VRIVRPLVLMPPHETKCKVKRGSDQDGPSDSTRPKDVPREGNLS
jgi:hypothetical protein